MDALEPTLLAGLVDDAIDGVRDPKLWEEALAEESSAKARRGRIATELPEVEACLEHRAADSDGEA